MKTANRQHWQRDPDELRLARIKVTGANGAPLTPKMKLSEAQQLVADGRAYVITAQAIGMCDNGVEHE